MIDDAGQVMRQLPARKAVLDKGAQDADSCEVLEEGIGSIASTGRKARRVVDHHTKKRTWKRFNQRLLINRHSVSGV